MKALLNKAVKAIEYIFGYGIMISLFVGGFSFFGYLAAFIIGGQTAKEICEFIYKDLYPRLIYFTSVIVILGIIKMYLCGQSALKSSSKKK